MGKKYGDKLFKKISSTTVLLIVSWILMAIVFIVNRRCDSIDPCYQAGICRWLFATGIFMPPVVPCP
jgi:hypothetical protein